MGLAEFLSARWFLASFTLLYCVASSSASQVSIAIDGLQKQDLSSGNLVSSEGSYRRLDSVDVINALLDGLVLELEGFGEVGPVDIQGPIV